MEIDKIKEVIDMIKDTGITELYWQSGSSKITIKRAIPDKRISDRKCPFKIEVIGNNS